MRPTSSRSRKGPPPRPTALKVLHGERADRVPRGEPVPSGEVEQPAGLSDGARREWARLAPDLTRKGVLTPWDVQPFAAYCTAVDRLELVRRDLNAADSLAVEGQRSAIVKHPLLQVERDLVTMVLAGAARFGLTPSDRAALGVKPAEQRKDPAAAILDG